MLRFPSGFNERVDIAKIQPNYRTKIEKVTLLALIIVNREEGLLYKLRFNIHVLFPDAAVHVQFP